MRKLFTKRTILATALMAFSATSLASTEEVSVSMFQAYGTSEQTNLTVGDNVGTNPDKILNALVEKGATILQNGYTYSLDDGESLTLDDTYDFGFDGRDYKRGVKFTTNDIDDSNQNGTLNVNLGITTVIDMEQKGDDLFLHTETQEINNSTVGDNAMYGFKIRDIDNNNQMRDGMFYFIVNTK